MPNIDNKNRSFHALRKRIVKEKSLSSHADDSRLLQIQPRGSFAILRGRGGSGGVRQRYGQRLKKAGQDGALLIPSHLRGQTGLLLPSESALLSRT